MLTDAAAYPLVYLRYNAEERILVVINPADKEYVVEAAIPTYAESSLIFAQGRAASICGKKATVYGHRRRGCVQMHDERLYESQSAIGRATARISINYSAATLTFDI